MQIAFRSVAKSILVTQFGLQSNNDNGGLYLINHLVWVVGTHVIQDMVLVLSYGMLLKWICTDC